jgi:dipeptidyl aminopeptidase/acylaminoacyl peptidase
LLVQGDADEEVDFQETIGVVRALRNLGRGDNVVEAMVFPDEAHGLATYAHQLRAQMASLDFFQRHLNAGAGGSA